MKKLILLIAGGMALLVLLLYATPASYLYCLIREGAWMRATTEKDLEASIWAPHTKKSIEPKESMWGIDHVLQPGQEMVQYKIFGKEPLDVVYFEDRRIDTVYTSYE